MRSLGDIFCSPVQGFILERDYNGKLCAHPVMYTGIHTSVFAYRDFNWLYHATGTNNPYNEPPTLEVHWSDGGGGTEIVGRYPIVGEHRLGYSLTRENLLRVLKEFSIKEQNGRRGIAVIFSGRTRLWDAIQGLSPEDEKWLLEAFKRAAGRQV